MKLPIKENRPLGFSQLELLAVILGVSLLAMSVLLAQVVGQPDARQRVCVNNLK